MSEKIERELGRIQKALTDPATTDDRYCQLYAAQQALVWALNPEGAAAPFDTINGGKVQPLIKGIPAGYVPASSHRTSDSVSESVAGMFQATREANIDWNSLAAKVGERRSMEPGKSRASDSQLSTWLSLARVIERELARTVEDEAARAYSEKALAKFMPLIRNLVRLRILDSDQSTLAQMLRQLCQHDQDQAPTPPAPRPNE